MVASFNMLMQNFYKVIQGNNEKVPSFAMRLEGTANQIQLQCPRSMMDLEAQQHLRDCLFHGVRKNIHGSIQYLYSTCGISYSQLMIAAQKAESENEETWDWVRVRAVITTEPVEGTAVLKHQIAQLIVALTQTGWENGHTSMPSSPQHCSPGCGCSKGGSSSCLGPGQTISSLQSSDRMCGRWCREKEQWARESRTQCEGNGCSWQLRPTLSSATGAKGRATWPESALHWHPL